jgi:hypothetical protein
MSDDSAAADRKYAKRKREEERKEKAKEHKSAAQPLLQGLAKPPERSPYIEIFLSKEHNVKFTFPGTMLAVGMPGSGKTHFGRYVLHELSRYITHGLIVCANPQSETEWDCVPPHFVSRVYSNELVEAFMQDQEQNGCPPAFLYFDDCLGEAEFNSATIKKLCTQFRKYNVFIWFGMQYLAVVLPPVIRQCIWYVYSFFTTERRTMTILCDSFMGAWFPKAVDFQRDVIHLPKHHCFYLNIKERQLNIVCAPSPEELGDFYLNWEINPPEDITQTERDILARGDDIGVLPNQWQRLQHSEEKRVSYERENIVKLNNQVEPSVVAKPNELTRAVAHGQAKKLGPNERGDYNKGAEEIAGNTKAEERVVRVLPPTSLVATPTGSPPKKEPFGSGTKKTKSFY